MVHYHYSAAAVFASKVIMYSGYPLRLLRWPKVQLYVQLSGIAQILGCGCGEFYYSGFSHYLTFSRMCILPWLLCCPYPLYFSI